jgi:hypothetical protein
MTCSLVYRFKHLGGTSCLTLQGRGVRVDSACYLLVLLTLRPPEAARALDVMMNFYRTTRRHIPEDITLHGYYGFSKLGEGTKAIPATGRGGP